jgi:hypothetical protein
MQKCLSLEVVIGDSQHEFYVPHCQSALSHPGIYMAGEVAESLVREMEGFSHLTIADMRLMSGSDPLLESVACTNSRVKAGCRAYPAGSLTAILQPQDHMSELIVLILSVIEELIDFAPDITIFPHGLLADGR